MFKWNHQSLAELYVFHTELALTLHVTQAMWRDFMALVTVGLLSLNFAVILW